MSLVLAGVLLAGSWSAAATPGEAGAWAGDGELGRRIFREGVLPSGEPVRGTMLGGVEVEGLTLACASCHRPSGGGSTEGGAFVPPIMAPDLFLPREPDRADLFRRLFQEVQPRRLYSETRDPRPRPAYDSGTLDAALREGVDPAGRRLDPMMPRYRLSQEDLSHLEAYLRSLGAEADPGVGAETIHLALVVTPDAPPARRQATLEVARAYVKRKNQDTADLLQRPGHSPLHHDDFVDSYRQWELYEWILEGPEEAWNEQLRGLYEEESVFAVVSGAGADRWQPVHDFCEEERIPCLFPNVDLPPSEPGAVSLYLCKGRILEAEILASHLRPAFEEGQRILQILRTGPGNEGPAEAFAEALAVNGCAALKRKMIEGEQPVTAEAWQMILEEHRPEAVVLWVGGEDLPGLGRLALAGAKVPEIYLGASALESGEVWRGGEAGGELPDELQEKLRVASPYSLPGQEPPRIHRVRGWLRARQVGGEAEADRLHTHFAFTVFEHSLFHLVTRFSRELLVEGIEHEVENALNPGVYPRLTLGPGQRFAAKGGTVLQRSDDGRWRPTASWIVPETAPSKAHQ